MNLSFVKFEGHTVKIENIEVVKAIELKGGYNSEIWLLSGSCIPLTMTDDEVLNGIAVAVAEIEARASRVLRPK